MTTPTAEKSPKARSSEQDSGSSVMGWVKNAAVIIGLVSTVVALLFVFLPDFKPEPSPNASGAALEQVSFDPDAPRRQYLARTDQEATGFTPEQLDRRGAFVLFSVALKGFKGKTLTLKQELIDTATGEQLSEERAIAITPPQNEITRDWHYWVALPARRGSFAIVIQILADGEDAALATLETNPFPGLSQ